MRRSSTPVLLILTACSHLSVQATPPTFGFFGVQCVPNRTVICMVDADFTAEQCRSVVPAAVADIAAAAGRPILVFEGTQPYSASQARDLISRGVYVIAGAATPPGVLGMTRPEGRDASHPQCITQVGTLLSPRIFSDPLLAPLAQAVVLHELLHGLGAAHAEPGTAFHSIMTPAIEQPGWASHLTAFDTAALRAAYQ